MLTGGFLLRLQASRIALCVNTNRHHRIARKLRHVTSLSSPPVKGFLPPANEVWGKVMFLHLSVSHSAHREGAVSQHALPRQTPPRPQAHTPLKEGN